jgi:hypothetical protein
MRRAVVVVVVLAAVMSGCGVLGLGLPPDLSCGSASPLADVDGYVFGDVEVGLTGISQSRALVEVSPLERGDLVSMRFDVDVRTPPALPPAGRAVAKTHQENCFGEGCNDAWWTLRDVDGNGWFEIGSANSVDGQPGGPREDDHLSVAANDDDDVLCPGREETLAALAVIRADDGDVELAPGEDADVVIDGLAWKAIAGSSTRTSFEQTETDCADCAGPGVHTTVAVEAVLYRVEP